jgi:two-component system OmpR family response regulator
MRLLVVEDERDLRRTLARALSEADFAVDESGDGEDALYQALSVEYDAIVLDLMLPKRSGAEVLAGLREAGRRTPVLMLTARDAVDDRVTMLDSGADDYVTKPFAIEEVTARLRALIRRAHQHPAPVLELGDISVDLARRRVFRGGEEVELTAREFGILELLAGRRGTIVTRSQLCEHLYNNGDELMSNAIDVHVASLRRKLGASVIQTRRGIGYLVDA